MAVYKRQKRVIAGCAILISLMMLAGIILPARVCAVDNNSTTVKVGYYENEVFQEGAGLTQNFFTLSVHPITSFASAKSGRIC